MKFQNCTIFIKWIAFKSYWTSAILAYLLTRFQQSSYTEPIKPNWKAKAFSRIHFRHISYSNINNRQNVDITNSKCLGFSNRLRYQILIGLVKGDPVLRVKVSTQIMISFFIPKKYFLDLKGELNLLSKLKLQQHSECC